ncbi:DUF1835 domain-containing protein [Thermaerobacillus caldiproteolyticus]|uniref:DUF1835 domain-containing protein n=1 Tax=Thermaerobacillus caldiproteolyticus TaxID=247480 RepID=UPI00188D784A|nr:DUF1835 domain-containing protein [Anoxybacillus caldiproteolyticus]QPA31145.1 DUF1835 domain-containing protein [Anoxybacillus caldiproteolyticus]
MDTYIVFGDSAAGGLKVALRDMGLDGESVIHFSDIFSIGPVWQLHTEAGRKYRVDWLKHYLSQDPYDLFFEEEYESCFQRTLTCIDSIPEQATIMIWSGENAHEQTGLRYVLYLLREKANRIVVINSAQAHREIFNTKEIQYHTWYTGEIGPEKLRVIIEQRKCYHFLPPDERNRLVQEWESLANSDAVLRIWKNEKIESVQEDYYDKRIIKAAKKLHEKFQENDFIKAARLIGEVYGHLNQYVGDQYLEYRLRALIEQGVFKAEGSLEAMRYYSVKLST